MRKKGEENYIVICSHFLRIIAQVSPSAKPMAMLGEP